MGARRQAAQGLARTGAQQQLQGVPGPREGGRGCGQPVDSREPRRFSIWQWAAAEVTAGQLVPESRDVLVARQRASAEVKPQAEPGRSEEPLLAYKGHAIAYVGRNLWCLDCFQAPGSAHRSWRHGRCEGTLPMHAMPAALRHAIARQPGATQELPSRTRLRWVELARALGGP